MPNRIQADKAVAESMESKGISQAIGVYGEHKIRLGKASPLRLDKIKANDVPFAGFRTATKVTSGKQGVHRSVADTLKFLCRPDGKLDARHLLGAIKAGSVHMQRLEQLGHLPAQAKDAPHMWMFADAVKKLGNNELAAIYQTFVTPHMDLLQAALQREGQINPQAGDARYAAEQLFDLQALVLKEVSDRVAVEREIPGADALPSMGERLEGGALVMPESTGPRGQDMSPANMLTLVETAAQSSTTREKTAHAVAAEFVTREIPRMSARVIGNVLRESELTINMALDSLQGEDSMLRQPDAPKANVFHLAKAGVNVKGDKYIERRDVTEKNLFPELAARPSDDAPNGNILDRINADERPTYAALNLQRKLTGAASPREYGSIVVVLKPHVAQRATYTVDDTFYNQPLNFSDERVGNFYRLLDTLLNEQAEEQGPAERQAELAGAAPAGQAPKPPHPVRSLLNPASPERMQLDSFFQAHKADSPPTAAIEALLHKLEFKTQARKDTMISFMLKIFGDPALSRSRTATYDNLEALVPGMRTDTSNSLAFMAAQRDRGAPECSLAGARYIEAQIQGPLIPSRDIAEIRYNPEELEAMPEVDRSAIIRDLDAFHRTTGIPVNAINMEVADARADTLQDVSRKFGEFQVQHWNRGKLEGAVKRYLDNFENHVKNALENYPPLAALLPAGESPVRGRALERLRAAFQRKFAEASEDPSSTNTEEGLAEATFAAVVSPVLAEKTRLMQTLETLAFDNPDQKSAFRNWVLSASVLKQPAELVFIHSHARTLAAQMQQMLNAAPPPDAATIFRAMSQAHDAIANDLQDLATALGGSLAPDEKATEFARVAFMAHALIQKADANGEANLLRLRQMLDSPEVRSVLGQLEALKAIHGEMELPPDSASLLGGVSYLQEHLRELQSSTKQAWEMPPAFIGSPSMMPQETWRIMESIAPNTTDALRRAYPPYEAFPAPAPTAALPATDAERRAFLIRHLDVYINHEQTFERGSSTHGRGHITRAYIYATAMCNMLEAQGLHPDRNAVLCGIAGHDMGRKAGGTDRWEGRSAAMTIKAMREDFGAAPADNDNSPERLAQVLHAERCEALPDPHSLGTDYETALARCIDSHRGKTLESMLLNSADSLDIGRVATFDLDKLEFLKGSLDDEAGEKIRQQLANEANILQRMTNPLCSLRNSIDALHEQILTAPSEEWSELLQTELKNIYADARQVLAAEWAQPNEAFVRDFEEALRRGKELMPLLYRYYFGENAA